MSKRILLAGETWISHRVDVKGFSSYSTGTYGEGQTELVEALEAAGHEVVHIANHVAVEQFPWTVGELAGYDVVMLSDISADTLQIHPDCFDRGQRTPDRLRLIASFVEQGGGLLMVGGYMSFSGLEGKARYQATPLAEVLPVVMLGYDDRVETPEGVVPSPVANEHAALEGVDGDWPHFLGYNRLVMKPGATQLLSVGGDPMLAVGSYGAGRTAAFASDCSPHWGSPEFMAWEHYGRFWGQLLQWLGSAGEGAAAEDVAAVA